MNIQQAVNSIKSEIEYAIQTSSVNNVIYDNGQKAKEALIRSQSLINNIHELIKHELVKAGVNKNKLLPPIGQSKPELNVAGFLKKKNQDVCVRPTNIPAEVTPITWGPLSSENLFCELGPALSQECLVINIRSQLSSIAKNTDTLFERTFAEALNLHVRSPKLCLGEVYLIPVYEYDNKAMKQNRIAFESKKVNLEKYINFFTFINGRSNPDDDDYKYEKCALIIVDFNRPEPKVYQTTQELIDDGHLDAGYLKKLEDINIDSFAKDLLDVYIKRFNNNNIFTDN